jgi:hypothetical protein
MLGEGIVSFGVAVALLVVEGDLDLLVGGVDPVELVDEVHVPGGAAELAVRR